MKRILKIFLRFLLKLVYGWNDTLADAFIRKIGLFFLKDNDEEIGIIRKLFKNKKEGILFDVGAHTGSFFENFIFKNWRIYAFEPDPAEIKQRILKDFEYLKNVRVFNYAISNKSGEILPFYASNESTGISSLHSFTNLHNIICEVNTITICDFATEQEIKEIDVLKIDTEGHDFFVLQGINWELIKPGFIMCEFEDRKTKPLGYTYSDLGNYLIEKGYKVFVSEWEPIYRYGKKCKWIGFKNFPCYLDNENGWGNFICFSNETNIDYSNLTNMIKK